MGIFHGLPGDLLDRNSVRLLPGIECTGGPADYVAPLILHIHTASFAGWKAAHVYLIGIAGHPVKSGFELLDLPC